MDTINLIRYLNAVITIKYFLKIFYKLKDRILLLNLKLLELYDIFIILLYCIFIFNSIISTQVVSFIIRLLKKSI